MSSFLCPIAFDSPCSECGVAHIIIDARQGDAVCGACGLVRASHLIADQAEYRCFGDSHDEDKCRLGAPVHELQHQQHHQQQQTSIAGNDRLNKLNQACWDRKQAAKLQLSPEFYERVSRLLVLPKAVVAQAVHFYQSTRPCFGPLSKAKVAALEAVCVFYACKAAAQLRVPKTKEQVCAAFSVPMALFWQVSNMFTDAAKGKPWYKMVTELETAPDMLPNLLNKVGYDWSSRQRMQVAERISRMYAENKHMMHLEIGGVLAAMLWLVCKDMLPAAASLSKAELAKVVGVTHTTISNNIKILQKKQNKK